MTSPRHADSESSLNRIKKNRRHQYDHVRASHPYEHVSHTVTPTKQSATPIAPVPTQEEQYDIAEVSKGSPHIHRWKNSLTQRERPSGKQFVSDSSLHRHSSKKHKFKNSPAPGKRFSAKDNFTDDKEALKMKKVPVGEQLQAQMLNCYFPSNGTRHGSSASPDQVSVCRMNRVWRVVIFTILSEGCLER